MNLKKTFSVLLCGALMMSCLSACGNSAESIGSGSAAQSPSHSAPVENEVLIALSDTGITVNNEAADTQPSAVYLSRDIIYYEDRDTYESGNPYGEGTAADRHTAQQAEEHIVVNITQPGQYRLTGQLSKGQIRVDLGSDAAEDPEAIVTLVLDNADISCQVAPAILFLNVYECDNGWDPETASSQVDTTCAGANLVLADGSVNNISGSYVARIYKDNADEKKLWKQDGAVYSYMSLNVDGTGTMNLTAENEGLDSELHLTINNGTINIYAQNDGINTNEDGVSVTAINGGNIHIIAGLGAEGDGIDSNGWLVINGGTVISSANPAADAGLDSDMGSYINGGTVVALGSAMDWAESDSSQVTMNLQFAQYKESDSAIVVSREDGSIIFAYDPSENEVLLEHTRKYSGAILSCPEFTVGDNYQVFIGGTLTGSEAAGVYDIGYITAFDGGVRQSYTGTDVMRHPGGMGGLRPDFGGEMPPMEEQRPDRGEMPPMPEGEMPPMGGPRPDRGEMPQIPEDEIPPMDGLRPDRSEMPQIPEGEVPPTDFPFRDMGGIPNEDGTLELQHPSDIFHMQDKVNFFSGVTNASE